MSLEEGDEGATFGAGLQQPNFAPGQCFLLARMSYIMVVVCVYCIFYIYIYIYIFVAYILYIYIYGWSIGMITIYCNPIWEAMLKQVLRSGSTSPSS
jgi:hypothetical protein